MSPFVDNHDAQLSERELALANSRAALRAEREQLSRDRAESERLLSEARETLAEAHRYRERARKLAMRFIRSFRSRQEQLQLELETKSATLAKERTQLDAEVKLFNKERSNFQLSSSLERGRIRDAWSTLRLQQRRVVVEWTMGVRHIGDQQKILNARSQDLKEQEQQLADSRARAEAETAGFREEATALEARILHARESLAELDDRRNKVLKEMLGVDLPGDFESTQLDQPLRIVDSSISLTSATDPVELRDRERLVAEQLRMLHQTRDQWQKSQEQTLRDMEKLAHELTERDLGLDRRELRLIRLGTQQRENVFHLWQLRLRLEAWHSRLTASELRYYNEREQLETDYQRRISVITRRESELEGTLRRLEQARSREREQLLAELELWTDDRKRLEAARIDFDRQRMEWLGELTRSAARAVAIEGLMSQLVPEQEAPLMERRLRVLRKRWEWRFQRRLREIAHENAHLSVQRAGIEERYQELQEMLRTVLREKAALQQQEDAALLRTDSTLQELSTAIASAPRIDPLEAKELQALRSEVERLANVLLEMELPESLEPAGNDIPWAEEATPQTSSDLLPFDSGSWAA